MKAFIAAKVCHVPGVILVLWSVLQACTTLPDSSDPVAQVRLVESVPDEVGTDNPEMANTEAQWADMISKARRSIDIAQFYVQTVPHSSMDRILLALEAAGKRGVAIRFLIDEAFIKRYPNDTGKTVETIRKWPSTEVRVTNRWNKMGGILHAKYFIVDGQDAFLGSQNFDWRAMDHIVELGMRMRSPPLVQSLSAIFNDDWVHADNQDAPQQLEPQSFQPAIWQDEQGARHKVSVKVSPDPDPKNSMLWDWPEFLHMIQDAKSHIQLSAMVYHPAWRSKKAWVELENALANAAQRGVSVHVMVDNRNKPHEFKPLLEAGVKVGFIKIPQHSSGAIPYARLTHAKYMIVDKQKAWLGTSNFEADYFYLGRNISLFVESPKLANDMSSFFERYWDSTYLALVKPDNNGILKARDEP